MATVPMTDAKFGEPASSVEYNKVTANVRDLDGRTSTVETNQGTRGARDQIYPEIQNLRNVALNSTTGNVRLGERLTTVENRTTDPATGNAALNSVTSHATTGNTALGNRATALETNQGTRGTNGPIYTEINNLKAQGAGSFKPTTATDTMLYGDVISSRPRSECWWGESVGNGFLTVQATRSAKAFTALALRFCIPAASAGNNGAFELKVYTGPSLNNLTERNMLLAGPGMTGVAGLKQIGLNPLPIAELDYVAIALLCRDYTTSPKFSSTAVGTGAQLLIGDGSPYSVFKGGQAAPIPSTINTLEAGWTRANQQFWFALL